MTYEYLMLELVRIGVRNPVQSNDKLYFVYDNKHYKLYNDADHYNLIEYTPQHNKNSIINAKYIINNDDDRMWKRVVELVKNPIGEIYGTQKEKEGFQDQ